MFGVVRDGGLVVKELVCDDRDLDRGVREKVLLLVWRLMIWLWCEWWELMDEVVEEGWLGWEMGEMMEVDDVLMDMLGLFLGVMFVFGFVLMLFVFGSWGWRLWVVVVVVVGVEWGFEEGLKGLLLVLDLVLVLDWVVCGGGWW